MGVVTKAGWPIFTLAFPEDDVDCRDGAVWKAFVSPELLPDFESFESKSDVLTDAGGAGGTFGGAEDRCRQFVSFDATATGLVSRILISVLKFLRSCPSAVGGRFSLL